MVINGLSAPVLRCGRVGAGRLDWGFATVIQRRLLHDKCRFSSSVLVPAVLGLGLRLLLGSSTAAASAETTGSERPLERCGL
jgi:hypothetical protein